MAWFIFTGQVEPPVLRPSRDTSIRQTNETIRRLERVAHAVASLGSSALEAKSQFGKRFPKCRALTPLGIRSVVLFFVLLLSLQVLVELMIACAVGETVRGVRFANMLASRAVGHPQSQLVLLDLAGSLFFFGLNFALGLFVLLPLLQLRLLGHFDEISFSRLELLVDRVAERNLVEKYGQVAVEPNIAHATGENIKQPPEGLLAQPFSGDTIHENRCRRGAKSVLGTRQVVLADLDVYPKLEEEDGADPDDHQDGHEKMSIIPSGIGILDIAPGECVKAGDRIGVVSEIVIIRHINFPTNTVYIIHGDQDRHDNTADWDKDDKKRLEIAQEEVGVETAFFDNFAIRVEEERLHKGKEAIRGRIGTFAIGDQVSFGLAVKEKS